MEFKDFRLSVSEAAKVFGVSQQTIRRALKASDLQYIIVQNRYKISFVSLLHWSQKQTSTKNKLANQGIGQFVTGWQINNTLYSPHPKKVQKQLNKKTEA